MLFTTSLSDHCREYFSFASILARQLKAKLFIVHVIKELQESYEGIAAALFGESRWRGLLIDQTARNGIAGIERISENDVIITTMRELLREASPGKSKDGLYENTFVVDSGNVADTILEQAHSNHCDLIIMGMSKGYLSGVSSSSHIKSVIKNSQIPVIVVPPFNI